MQVPIVCRHTRDSQFGNPQYWISLLLSRSCLRTTMYDFFFGKLTEKLAQKDTRDFIFYESTPRMPFTAVQ